jgi:hypothetical protein
MLNITSLMMQAITGDSVLLKFEKAKCAIVDSLKLVEDIVSQSIACQVITFNNIWLYSFSFRV